VRRSRCAELILALGSSSQFYNLKPFFFVASHRTTAVVTYCFYFVTPFTASDFCLSVNPTVLCGYVTLSLYWISLQFSSGIQEDVATQTNTEIQLN